MDAQEYIKQHVNRMVAKRGATASAYKATTINIPRKRSDSLSNILVSMILLIGIGTLCVMLFFSSVKGKELLSNLFNKPEVKTDFLSRDDAQTFISSINQRVGNLEEEMKVWKYRIWLLGVANNENVALLDKMDAAHHKVKERGFVRLDDNWRLSPMPKHLQLTDEQKKQIVSDQPIK